jgi:hypothetical protein
VDNVEVSVVVQDADIVSVGDCGKDEIDRRESVMSCTGELALRVYRPPLDLLVDPNQGQRQELLDQLGVVSSATRRVPSLQQEWQAHRNAAIFQGGGDLVRS